MLDGLLKPKVYSKCKSYVRLTKTRLDTIRKRRNAVEKFLKNDIADLLRSALDYNAYGRAEGLLVEQNMSSCYELIAKYVECIADHVRDLYKQRDCPDECKEAIPSLVYAAARFSDLPELRDLRTLFTEKFGNSLEPYLSKEFVNKLRQDPPSKEMKIQLLRDLAQEFSIQWDSKALERRLYSPPVLHELQGKAKHDPLNACDGKKRHKNNDVTGAKQQQPDGRECLASEGRKGMSDASWRLQSNSEDETSKDNSSQHGQKTCSSSLGSLSEDEVETKRPFSNRLVPPPYVREKSSEDEGNMKKTTTGSEAVPEKESKPIPRSVRRRPRNPPPGYDTVSHSKADDTAAKVDSRDEEEREMDRFLMHHVKKQSSYESGTGKAYPWKQAECDEGQNIRRTRSGSGAPVTGTCLPPKDTKIPSMGTLKERGRATSLNAHPRLPDYDDLSARLAALRRT